MENRGFDDKANLYLCSKHLSSKTDLENCVNSCVVKSENCNSSLKELNNFVKPSTFFNISNENSQGYRSIEKKVLNCIEW